MSFAIAAAGTGGHVFPGLAVAEALVRRGVPPERVLFVGGYRMESDLVPEQGFPLLQVELMGLSRGRAALRNLRIPAVVGRAAKTVGEELSRRGVRKVLCMGSYVTVPTAIAARRLGIPIYLHEQNAEAGLANRFTNRWAERCFLTYPATARIAGEIVGYPLRVALAYLDKEVARDEALARYGLVDGPATVGVMGGSLGSPAINDATSDWASRWSGPPLQIVHLAGADRVTGVSIARDAPGVTRRVLGFEHRMDLFYAISDLVVARSGGGQMEAAVTGTPIILVPGRFAGGHQRANAEAMADAGAAILVDEAQIDTLGEVLTGLLEDEEGRVSLSRAARQLAHPKAADTIAAMMLDGSDVATG